MFLGPGHEGSPPRVGQGGHDAGGDGHRQGHDERHRIAGGEGVEVEDVVQQVGDAEEADKLKVAREFIALEAQAEGAERTAAFWDLLVAHVRLGGYLRRVVPAVHREWSTRRVLVSEYGDAGAKPGRILRPERG